MLSHPERHFFDILGGLGLGNTLLGFGNVLGHRTVHLRFYSSAAFYENFLRNLHATSSTEIDLIDHAVDRVNCVHTTSFLLGN